MRQIPQAESSRPSRSKQVCGRCLVVLMNLFIVFQIDGFWRLSLPWFALPLWMNFLLKLASGSLFVVIEFFYACTCLIDPGSPGSLSSCRKEIQETSQWCDFCMAPKPDRCHDCSTCGRCVLRMDHHCIFTNSCVGLQNQPYFLIFVLLTMCGSGLSALAATPQIPSAVASISFGDHTTRQAHLIALCLSAAIASVLLWNLLLVQMHLVIRNETTIESLKNWSDRCHSRFDQGVQENIVEVFGSKASKVPKFVFDILDGLDQFLAADDL